MIEMFKMEFHVLKEDNEILYELTKQIFEYRLHEHWKKSSEQIVFY